MATTQEDATPTGVAQLATQQVHLERLALLGIFGTEDVPAALVRGSMGATWTVRVGDSVAGGIVTTIGSDRVVVRRAGRLRVLRLP